MVLPFNRGRMAHDEPNPTIPLASRPGTSDRIGTSWHRRHIMNQGKILSQHHIAFPSARLGVVTAVLVAAWIMLPGCGPMVDVSCQVGDQVYEVGDHFPAPDGCNTCTCEEHGGIACTEMGCVETCVYQGVTYMAGQSFPAGDDCNQCSCGSGGSVACTTMWCDPMLCEYEGSMYEVGTSFPAGDGCNTCTCQDNGSVACTQNDCDITCSYAGQIYLPGDQFPMGDGCNTCTCQADGTVLCTDEPCAS
jgi:hypothetical protein